MADPRRRLAGGDLGPRGSRCVADRRGERDLGPSGRIEELFNGQNINQWTPVSGSWSQAKNDEGALGASRPWPGPAVDFRSQRGGRAAAAGALSADAGRRSAPGIGRRGSVRPGWRQPGRQYLFVRIDGGGSTLGTRTAAPRFARTIVHARPCAQRRGLHAVEIERQSGGWWVLVDGELLGSAPFLHATPAAEFRLAADGGFAWFSDFTFEQLEPRAAK